VTLRLPLPLALVSLLACSDQCSVRGYYVDTLEREFEFSCPALSAVCHWHRDPGVLSFYFLVLVLSCIMCTLRSLLGRLTGISNRDGII
jgi:hypothetical protein